MSNRLQGKATVLSAENKSFSGEKDRKVEYVSVKVLLGDDTFTMTSHLAVEELKEHLREEVLYEFSVIKKITEKAEFPKLTLEAIVE